MSVNGVSITSSGSCSSSTTPSSCSNKFKATTIWRSMVRYLRLNVKQKKRRLILKGIGPTECFSGSDLCDTTLLFLLMDNEHFKTSDLTRDKARKLCQLLFDNEIISSLGGVSVVDRKSTVGGDRKFEDTSSKYYIFSERDSDTCSIDSASMQSQTSNQHNNSHTSSKRSSDSDEDYVYCNPLAEDIDSNEEAEEDNSENTGENNSQNEEIITNTKTNLTPFSKLENKLRSSLRGKTAKKITDNLFKRSLDCESVSQTSKYPRTISAGTGTPGVFRRKMSFKVNDIADKPRHSSVSSRKPPLPPTSKNTNNSKSSDVCSVDKIAQLTGDVIFSPAASLPPSAISDMRQEIALSQLSYMIDLPILEGLICNSQTSLEEPGYDNAVFFDLVQNAGYDEDDSWISAGIEVMDHIPNGHKTTFDYHIGSHVDDYKLALYRSILKMYRTRTDPLLPSTHETIHKCALELVVSGDENRALRVIRLSSVLIPCYILAEITALLQFLQAVCVSGEPKIKPGQNNNDAVLNDYCGIFFMDSRELVPDSRRVLLLFLLRHSSKIQKVPSSVQLVLERTMQNLKRGDDTPLPSALFCAKITASQMQSRSRDVTEMAIVSLVRSVIDDTKTSLKDKQKMLKNLQKHHSEIMLKYFGDIV